MPCLTIDLEQGKEKAWKTQTLHASSATRVLLNMSPADSRLRSRRGAGEVTAVEIERSKSSIAILLDSALQAPLDL